MADLTYEEAHALGYNRGYSFGQGWLAAKFGSGAPAILREEYLIEVEEAEVATRSSFLTILITTSRLRDGFIRGLRRGKVAAFAEFHEYIPNL